MNIASALKGLSAINLVYLVIVFSFCGHAGCA